MKGGDARKKTVTRGIIRHHADMESKQFDGVTDEEKTKVWGLYSSDDRQVNGEHIFRQYYDNVIHFNGEHRMTDEVIKTVLIPLVRKITNS